MKSNDFSVKVNFRLRFFVFGLVFKDETKSDFKTKRSVVQNAANANDWISSRKELTKKLPVR